MKPYRNPESGIIGYEDGDGWIHIQFAGGTVHAYTASAIGEQHLATLKRLAALGKGLNTYINTNPQVKNRSFTIG